MNPLLNIKTCLTLALVGGLLAGCGGAEGTDADTAPLAVKTATVSAAQAETLRQAQGERLLDVDLDCCAAFGSPGGADLAVLMAYGVQAALDLGNDTPVIVHGRDPRLTAATAQRLAAAGYANVLVVTQ